MSLFINRADKTVLTSIHCLTQSGPEQAIEMVKDMTAHGMHVCVTFQDNNDVTAKNFKQTIREQKISNVDIVKHGFGENCFESLMMNGYDPRETLCLAEPSEKEEYISEYDAYSCSGKANIAVVDGSSQSITSSVQKFSPATYS